MTDRNITISILCIGTYGTYSCFFISQHIPFQVTYCCKDDIITADTDCIVVLSALEDDAIEMIIDVADSSDALVFVIALEPDGRKLDFYSRVSKVVGHCCVIVSQDTTHEGDLSFKFIAGIIRSLFSPFFRPNCYTLDLAELKSLLAKGTIAYAAFNSAKCAKLVVEQIIRSLMQQGVRFSKDTEVLVNVWCAEYSIQEEIAQALLQFFDDFTPMEDKNRRAYADVNLIWTENQLQEIGVFVLVSKQSLHSI